MKSRHELLMEARLRARVQEAIDMEEERRQQELLCPKKDTAVVSAPKEKILVPRKNDNRPRPPRDPKDPRPRVLLVSDVRDWAFDVNAKAMEKYLPEFKCTHVYMTDIVRWPDPWMFDAMFMPFHRWGIDAYVPWDRALGSLRSASFWAETGAPPGPAEIELVNKHRAFYTVTREPYEALKAHCPNVMYLTNPVDTRMFNPDAITYDEIVASWTGNARHANGIGLDVKGFDSIVRPACSNAAVRLEFAEYSTNRLPHAQMPAFYAKGNVTLCASSYEGCSNSVLEAMACGHAVIATDVGNHREMRDSQLRHFGHSGIELVDRDIDAFAEALRRLKSEPVRIGRMGQLNAREIRDRWSWPVWRDRYAAFFRKGLS